MTFYSCTLFDVLQYLKKVILTANWTIENILAFILWFLQVSSEAKKEDTEASEAVLILMFHFHCELACWFWNRLGKSYSSANACFQWIPCMHFWISLGSKLFLHESRVCSTINENVSSLYIFFLMLVLRIWWFKKKVFSFLITSVCLIIYWNEKITCRSFCLRALALFDVSETHYATIVYCHMIQYRETQTRILKTNWPSSLWRIITTS